jgi:DNA-binding MarR family transcriptional regulator
LQKKEVIGSEDERSSATRLAFQLRDILGRGARRVRIEAGPPLSQLTVLGHLQRRGALSTNDLAAAERVRPQSMTATVKALEKDGLLGRRPHPTDGRQMLLEMTPKGAKTLEDIFAMREDWLTTLIIRHLDDRDRHDLERGLALINKIIESE